MNESSQDTSESLHPADWPVERLLQECDVKRTRRSGPGGQHRNKVETAIVLTHRPTGIQAEAAEARSQSVNKTKAIFRLRLLLAIGFRTRRSADDVPSPLWTSRGKNGRLIINESHGDFPSLIAEAFDVLQARNYDVPTAADALQCSGSQLVKLMKRDSQVWTAFGQQREKRGLPRLR